MISRCGKFPAAVLCAQTALIIVYAFFVTYDAEVVNLEAVNGTNGNLKRNSIQDYYAMFQDVNVMILVGFGFLMTFLKKYGFSAVGINMLLAAISVQWAIVMQGVWQMNDGRVPINIVNIINGNFAAAAVLISYGALLGKASPFQMFVMALLEIALFACNEYLGSHVLQAVDIGGSIFVHTFGAYFGLAVTYMLYRKDFLGSNKEGSAYHTDLFAMIGTLFLWMFWPSFNSALAYGEEQHRSVINTYLALLSCCVITFAISSLAEKEGRLNMVHIQNATLAGGVAIGSSANVLLHPFGAMFVGASAAVLSVVGYKLLTPVLAQKFHIHDTCGVNNLHGMPGVFAGLVSAVVASLANEMNYGIRLYELYPARSPHENTTEFHVLHSVLSRIEPGSGWPASFQAYSQLEALGSTIAIAVIGGLITGYIIRLPFFDPPKKLQLFDDTDYWEVPEEDHP